MIGEGYEEANKRGWGGIYIERSKEKFHLQSSELKTYPKIRSSGVPGKEIIFYAVIHWGGKVPK